MSAVAGLLVTAAVTPAIAVTGMAANNGIGVFEGLPEYLQIGASQRPGLKTNPRWLCREGRDRDDSV